MPSADSAARSLRVADPDAGQPGQVGDPQPGRARGAGRARGPAARAARVVAVIAALLRARGASPPAAPRPRRSGLAPPRRAAAAGSGRGVADDPPVQHPHLAAHRGGDLLVVGDDHDRGPGGLVELAEQVQDRGAGGLVQVAGRLVGQHDRRLAGDRPGDRHPLPLAAGQLGGPGAQLVAEPDPVQRGRRPARGAGPGPPRRTAARRPRCPARSGARPGRTAGTRTRCSPPAARPAAGRPALLTSRPATRTVPAVGRSRVPARCSSVLLPDPDGPSTATSSPAATDRVTPRRAGTGGLPG